MIADKLRKSILQAAIQGKLTEQLASDGDARDLLADIQKEKKRLIKDKKIKKEQPLPPIEDDDIPFDIPDNWVWVRLHEIFNFIDYRGMTPQKINSGVTLITANNIKIGYIDMSLKSYISESDYLKRNSRGVTNKGDILFTTEAPLGHCCINPFDKCSCGQRIITFQEYGNTTINKAFFMHVILTVWFQKELSDQRSGVTAKGIKAAKLKLLHVPLPPLAEQQRIVERLEEILPSIAALEKDESKLDTLQQSFPKKMKDSLLQAAIQGKLTEQLASDGSAQDLLKDIQAEKKRLIKEGKIKKERPLPEITEDEISFDIPENWEWVRLGTIISLKSGQDMESKKYSRIKTGIPYITGASNFDNGKLIINRWTKTPQSVAYCGDLLITCKGTIGEIAVLNEEKVHIARQIMGISTFCSVEIPYIKYFLLNYVSTLKSMAKSMIPGISRDMILTTIIPLPPLEEQKRIVARLEELLPKCDELGI